MPLTGFTTAFTGGPAFYTGTSASSALVPYVFPVAINGRPYQVDTKARFIRAFEDRLRESSDDGAIPGEATINPQGLWRRAQTSWHFGAGQHYADTSPTALPYRFWRSKGIDPWTEGEARLLYDTTQSLTSTETNLPLVVVGSKVYVGDGGTLKESSDLVTWSSTITSGAPAGPPDIVALATNGTSLYVSYTNASIYTVDLSTGAATILYPSSGSTAYTFNVLEYVKGWLIACHDNDMHVITSGSSSHASFYAHPNSGFDWVGVTSGQNVVYAAGHAGDISLVYKLGLKEDGTGFDVPIVAGELPSGERIFSIGSYLGFVVLGTDRGVRFCTSDQNNDLVIGPVIETSTSVQCGVGFGRFYWFGWTNYDAFSTGLGRMDFGQLIGQNLPAHASDLMAGTTAATVQGAVKDVVMFDGKPVFSVAGKGVYKQSGDRVASGRLESGVYRWGIPDPKVLAFVDLQVEPLAGQVAFCRQFEGGTCIDVGNMTVAGSTFQTYEGPTTTFREAALELVLTRSASDATVSPVLQRWQARAVPVPSRSELFSIPLLLHPMVRVNSQDYFFDVDNELVYLRDLVASGNVVQFQVGTQTYNGIVENIEWETLGFFGSPLEVEGTATVTLRSLK